MAKKAPAPKTLDVKGLTNSTLVKLVTSHHKKGTRQVDVAKDLTEKGYETVMGGAVTQETVRKFERLIGLGSRDVKKAAKARKAVHGR